MTEYSLLSRGQIAYEAYCRSTGGVSLVSGDKLPTWDDLPPKIQTAWREAGDRVANHVVEMIFLGRFRDLARRFLGIERFS